MNGPFLRTLFIELTTICPLKCVHCYLTGKSYVQLDLDQVIDVVDQAERLNVLKLTFTGGDILSYPFIDEVLMYARQRGFCVNVLSSLYTHDLEKIKLLKNTVHQLGVSLYGSTPREHEAVTGICGSFDVTVHNIEVLKPYINLLNVNVSLLRHNIVHWKQIRDFVVYELGANVNFNFRIFDQLGRLDRNIMADEKEIISYLNQAVLPLNPRAKICNAGRRTLCILADGTISPCVFFSKALGNIKRDSLASVWENSEYLKRLRTITEDEFCKCRSCQYEPYFYGCIGDNYSENADVTIPSKNNCDMCRLYHDADKLLCI